MFILNENWESWEKFYDIERKTKNYRQTFNHLIKLVLNFELHFSMIFGILYIYIYMFIYIYTWCGFQIFPISVTVKNSVPNNASQQCFPEVTNFGMAQCCYSKDQL
jgi:hypothetical protein